MFTTGILCALIPANRAVVAANDTCTVLNPRLEQARWFQDAKFGMFIHFGPSSVLGRGEWVMHNEKMTVQHYENTASRFNPVDYDPAEWVQTAKNAGAKYITVITKHHDGFAMWDSKVSGWDIVDHAPYKKDFLKMLADQCAEQDIKLFLYYSHLDWHHPDYYPPGRTGRHAGRAASGQFDRYLDYMNAQIVELCSGKYGKIAGFWFDGWWDQQIDRNRRDTHVDWQLKKTYDLIHTLQPQALIGNNHHVAPFEGEDFQMFEKGLPGKDKFSSVNYVSKLPLETCETINNSWGYNKSDTNFKSTKQLIHYLVRAAGTNANLLLNVGPMPNGKIQGEFVQRLEEIGKWLAKNGDTIYGTRGGPVSPQRDILTTQKKDKVYVHILKAPQENKIILPRMAGIKIKSVKLFENGRKIPFSNNGRFVLDIWNISLDPIDTIVVLKIEKSRVPQLIKTD